MSQIDQITTSSKLIVLNRLINDKQTLQLVKFNDSTFKVSIVIYLLTIYCYMPLIDIFVSFSLDLVHKFQREGWTCDDCKCCLICGESQTNVSTTLRCY